MLPCSKSKLGLNLKKVEFLRFYIVNYKFIHDSCILAPTSSDKIQVRIIKANLSWSRTWTKFCLLIASICIQIFLLCAESQT